MKQLFETKEKKIKVDNPPPKKGNDYELYQS